MKKRIVVATIKSWNLRNARRFKNRYRAKYNVLIISKKRGLNYIKISKFGPKYIFIPHWSWPISRKIYDNFECILFHMTDLPFGRGGSPLQNLILRSNRKTKISAIRVTGGLDAGPVYMRRGLDLAGSATDIYERASRIIFDKMMPGIIHGGLLPIPQKGRTVLFKRRSALDGDISWLKNPAKAYDWIRMLDAEGYPPAFIETRSLRIEFSDASIHGNHVSANAKIKGKR